MRMFRSRTWAGRGAAAQTRAAFTLLELMVVVGVMGIVLAMGIPTIYKIWDKESMRRTTTDISDVFATARARAILLGVTTDVVFHPVDGRVEVGASPAPAEGESGTGTGAMLKRPTLTGGSGMSAKIPGRIVIEMLDVNLIEYREAEQARVRFFPNGTSDEMTLILRSDEDEWRMFSLEITTGLLSVTDKIQ